MIIDFLTDRTFLIEYRMNLKLTEVLIHTLKYIRDGLQHYAKSDQRYVKLHYSAGCRNTVTIKGYPYAAESLLSVLI